jgi:hypothetical protein
VAVADEYNLHLIELQTIVIIMDGTGFKYNHQNYTGNVRVVCWDKMLQISE